MDVGVTGPIHDSRRCHTGLVCLFVSCRVVRTVGTQAASGRHPDNQVTILACSAASTACCRETSAAMFVLLPASLGVESSFHVSNQ